MDLNQIFYQRFQSHPNITAIAPGSVNLLGEHVDYNEGIVLPIAIDRYAYFAATLTKNKFINLYAADLGEEVQISFESLSQKRSILDTPIPEWASYPAGVAWALIEAGYNVPGMEVVYSSTIPIGSGLSSSAAIEIGFAKVCQSFGQWEASQMLLAQICQRAENSYVGVSSGLTDQFASACGESDHVLFLDTRDLQWGKFPLPEDISLVIADSGIKRDLGDTSYNDRRRSCENALSKLQKYLPDIKSLRDVTPTEFAAIGYYLIDEDRKRAEHVIKEIARVESAINALNRADYTALGALLYAGHRSLRDLYEVSTSELDLLVDLAHDLPGCLGSRLTGVGFGGSTVNLVRSDYMEDFKKQLEEKYYLATGINAQVFECNASMGAVIKEYYER